MMSGVGLAAAIAALTAVNCWSRFGYAVISRVTFGSPFSFHSAAISFWTSLWNGTYCQKVSVVGALALTVGALSGIGLTSWPVTAGTAVGWPPPMLAPVTGVPAGLAASAGFAAVGWAAAA